MTGPVLLSALAAGAFGPAPPAVPAQDTISFTIIVDGHRKGERRMWQGHLGGAFRVAGEPSPLVHGPGMLMLRLALCAVVIAGAAGLRASPPRAPQPRNNDE